MINLAIAGDIVISRCQKIWQTGFGGQPIDQINKAHIQLLSYSSIDYGIPTLKDKLDRIIGTCQLGRSLDNGLHYHRVIVLKLTSVSSSPGIAIDDKGKLCRTGSLVLGRDRVLWRFDRANLFFWSWLCSSLCEARY